MAGVLALAPTTSVAQTAPGAHWAAGSGSSSKQHGPASAQIKALQKSRIETWTELVTEYELLAQAGRIDFDSVVAAQNELVDAKLDLAEKPQERVALLTEKMKLAEVNWQRTKDRFQAHRATKSDLLRARVFLLGAEIGLSQERMAAGLPAPKNLLIPADGLPWRVPPEPPEQTKSSGMLEPPLPPPLPEEKLPGPLKPP
jgi:hypothetical protein